MAILKRRKPHGWGRRVRESVWPSMGWLRTVRYYRHRIFRTGDSAYRITAGLASGAAVSWSPFLGTHFAQAVFLSWLLRANMLAGFVGTAWGNPWTFPFMFWLSYRLGVFICGLFGLKDFVAIGGFKGIGQFIDNPGMFLEFLFAHPLQFLLPLTLGGYICGVLFWPLAYGILYYPVRITRKTYRKQRLRRIYRKMRERQGRTRKSGQSADRYS